MLTHRVGNSDEYCRGVGVLHHLPYGGKLNRDSRVGYHGDKEGIGLQSRLVEITHKGK